MSPTKFLVLVFLLTTLLVGCEGPLAYFPGGALQGTPMAVPDGWACTDEVDTIQFETNPAEPYSVNIWVVALGEHLYVHAGDNRKRKLGCTHAKVGGTVRQFAWQVVKTAWR